MVRLYILRHAKSSWAQPGVRDYDRALDERGQSDLPRIADMLGAKGYLPGAILCSPSVRTRMTLHGIMSAYGEPPKIDYDENLYTGPPEAYWEALQARQEAGDVMIVGHNPMCEIVAGEAAPKGEPAAISRMKSKFPTGALAVIDFDADEWSDVRPGRGRLVDFIVPREL